MNVSKQTQDSMLDKNHFDQVLGKRINGILLMYGILKKLDCVVKFLLLMFLSLFILLERQRQTVPHDGLLPKYQLELRQGQSQDLEFFIWVTET